MAAMDTEHASRLRKLAAEVDDAVEARIRGEAGAVERVRRAAQGVQMVGMGPFEYWGNQLWQVSSNSKIIASNRRELMFTIALERHLLDHGAGDGPLTTD
jgi:hypothetical protein